MADEESKRDVNEADPAKKGKTSDGDDGQDSESKTVPLAALKAVTRDNQKLKAELSRLSGLVEGLKAGQQNSAPAEKQEQVYTRAQLKAAVNEGKITEEQMEALWETQIEKKIERRVDAKTTKAASEGAVAANTQAELARYIEAFPELADTDSDLRAKVQDEFDFLVRLGDDPDSRATELKAVRAALGPVTGNKGRRKEPEASEETGGAQGGRKGEPQGDGWSKGLTPKMKAHYQKLINQGLYKGEAGKKALDAELAHARARVN